jgi:hypothetical protein
VGKGLSAHPVPVIIIVLFAVDKAHQGHVIGKAMLCYAILKTVEAADTICGRAILIYAKDA